MSNYTIAVNWSGKDSLSDSDPAKVLSGSDFNTEFTTVQTAVNTKADLNGSASESFAANSITAAGVVTGGSFVGVFAAGTRMLFAQAAAPTGWTQITTYNDKALRVVNGTGAGTGGTHGLSSPPSTAHSHSTPNHTHTDTFSAASHTLTTSQIPSHRHYVMKADSATGGGDFATDSPIAHARGYTQGGLTNENWEYELGKAGDAGDADAGTSSYTGGGAGHTHAVSGSISSSGASTSGSTTPTAFAPAYLDVIICAKA